MNPSNKWPSIKSLIADFLKILHQINPLKSSFPITHIFTDLEEKQGTPAASQHKGLRHVSEATSYIPALSSHQANAAT